jgi:hypothetical protein
VDGGENIWEYLPVDKVRDESGRCVKPEEGDTRPLCVREVGGKTFVQVYSDGRWQGIFEGTDEEHGMVIIHPSGRIYYWGINSFEGSVNGNEGTLKMFVYGWLLPEPPLEWQGKWVILRGAGDLEDLRGRGTWWGPGWQGDPNVWGVLEYDGKIRFDDD